MPLLLRKDLLSADVECGELSFIVHLDLFVVFNMTNKLKKSSRTVLCLSFLFKGKMFHNFHNFINVV